MAKQKVRKLIIEVTDNNTIKLVTKGFEKFNKEADIAVEKTGEIDRKLKATAGATSNTTKIFAKQAQGLGGLVHVYATVAANVFALSSAYLVLKRNADLQNLISSAENLSRATGINFVKVARDIKEISNNALGLREALQTTNLALSGGLNTEQLEKLTAIATKAAAATGRSIPESIQRMVQAVVKAEPELIDEFGIILRVQKAVEDYAVAHNKAAKDLTTFERQQAIAAQAIERGNKAYKSIKLEDIANPYEKLAASLGDLTNSIITFVSGPFSALADNFANSSLALGSLIALIVTSVARKAIPVLQDFQKNMVSLNKQLATDAVNALKKYNEELLYTELQFSDVKRSVGRLSKELPGIISKFKDLNPNTALAKAIKRGATGKELINALATTLNNSYKKAFEKASFDLEDLSKKTFKLAGAKLSRNDMYVLLSGTLASERGFSKGFRENIERVLESQKAQVKVAKTVTAKLVVEWKARWAAYKAIASQAFIEAAQAENLIMAKSAGKRAAENIFKELGVAAPKFAKALGSTVGVLSRIFTFTASIFTKFVGFGIALSVVGAIIGPIVNSLGIWNTHLSDIVEKATDYKDELLDISRAEKLIAEQKAKHSTSLDNNITLLNNELQVVNAIAKKYKEIQEAIEATAQMNAFQRFFSGIDLEDAAKGIAEYTKRIKNLPKVKTFSFTGTKLVKKDYYKGQGTYDAVKAKVDLEVNIENIKNGKLLEEINRLREKASFKGVTLDKDNVFSRILDLLLEINKESEELIIKQKTGLNSIKEGLVSLDDSVLKIRAGLTQSSPLSPIISSLHRILDGIRDAGDSFAASKEELEKRLTRATRNALGIKSFSDIQNIYDKLLSLQAKYLNRVTTIKAREAELQAIKLTEVNNITAQFNAEKRLQEAKVAKAQAELEIARKNLSFAKDSVAYKNQVLIVEEKANILAAERAKLNENFNTQKLILRHMAVEIQRSAEYAKQYKSEFAAAILPLQTQLDIHKKFTRLTAEDIDRLNAINKLKNQETKKKLELLKQDALIIQTQIKNTKDLTKQERLRTKLSSNILEQYKLQSEEQLRQLEIAKQIHEIKVKTTEIGQSGFGDVVREDIKYTFYEFERTRQRWAKTITSLMVDPITSAMNTLTNEIIEGTKTFNEIVKDSLKAGYNEIVKGIMKQLASDFKSALLGFFKDSPFIQKLLGGNPVEKANLDANTRTAINTGQLVNILSNGQATQAQATNAGISTGVLSGLFSNFSESMLGFSNVSLASQQGQMLLDQWDFTDTIASFLGFAKGGIVNGLDLIPGYASGGIVTNPHLAMVGEGSNNEAIVPLPDNRSIPVELKGATNNNNISIVINVDVEEGKTSAQTSGIEDADRYNALGNMLSNAVHQKLIEEMRPGGLLYK